MFYTFGTWLINLDEVEAVTVERLGSDWNMIVHTKRGVKYQMNCGSDWNTYLKERNSISMAMRCTHPEPVSRYEVEGIVRREVQKARGDIRTLKNILLEGLEELRREKKILDLLISFVLCYTVFALCWIGAEWVFEGTVHTSQVDTFFCAFLSWIVARDM